MPERIENHGGEFTVGENRWKLRGALRAIRVNYSFGTVYVRSHSGAETELREKNIGENAEPARFTFSKGVLSIEFTGKKSIRRGLEGVKDIFAPKRSIEILVPARSASELLEIKLSSQSAGFSVSHVSAEVFECETASGDASVSHCSFESAVFSSSSGDWSSKASSIVNLSLDTSGGDADVRGSVKRLTCENASGDMLVQTSSVPEELSFDSASGTCKLYLPKYAEFTAQLNLGSGESKVSGFEGFYLGEGTEQKYICGKAGGRYTISTATGSVGIYANA